MKREVKFRAWDKSYKHFHEGDLIREYVIGEFIDDPDYEVTQYIGLKDRNGLEIYEGDIVKGHWWSKGEAHRHIGRVTYVMNKFVARGVKQYYGMDDSDLNPTYEVIGNIYENPELLN